MIADHAAKVLHQRELEYKTLMDEKMAQISELRVFMMNATESIQKSDEKFDKLLRTLSGVLETAKAELTEPIRQVNS